MERDTPIHKVTFLEMSDQEQVKFVEHLRDLRQKPLTIYNEVMAAKKAAKNAKLQIQFDKAKQAFDKALELFDKKYEDVVKKANKLKELQIEIDLEQ